MSQALQQGDDAAFDFEAAVVAADGDSHDGPGSSLIARLAQKKVSGTFRRSKLQQLLRLESSRHLFLGKALIAATPGAAVASAGQSALRRRGRSADRNRSGREYLLLRTKASAAPAPQGKMTARPPNATASW